MIPQLPKKVNGLLAKESMDNVRAFKKAFEESKKRYAPKVDVDDTDSPVGMFIFIFSFFIENLGNLKESIIGIKDTRF